MSPATIAIVSVVLFVVLMIAVKMVVGSLLHKKDQALASKQAPDEH